MGWYQYGYVWYNILQHFFHLLNVIFSDPYHWAWLPYAKHPFSDEIRQLILHKLENMDFVQELVDDLNQLFKVMLS